MAKERNIIVKFLLRVRQLFAGLFFDPWEMLMKWRALPAYCRNMYAYSKARTTSVPPIEFSRLFFTTYEKYMPGGTAVGHFFSGYTAQYDNDISVKKITFVIVFLR
jgi:hypothetical protein